MIVIDTISSSSGARDSSQAGGMPVFSHNNIRSIIGLAQALTSQLKLVNYMIRGIPVL